MSDEFRAVEEHQRVCKSCSVLKPIEDFYRDGHRWRRSCIACLSSEKKERFLKVRTSAAYNAPEAKAKRSLAARNHYVREREVVLARSRESYLRNKDLVNARSLVWQRANKDYRRAAMAQRRAKPSDGESHTKQDIAALFIIQKGLCAICRSSVGANYHVDHITALANGGEHVPNNLQLLCPTCNVRKSAKDPIQFMQSRGFLL